MHKFTNAISDATIYSDTELQNTSLDSILQISKTYFNINGEAATTASISRILVKFDLSDISSSIVNGTITSPVFYLNLCSSNASNLKLENILEVGALSQSFETGIGTRLGGIETGSGVTWKYRDADESSHWTVSGSDYISEFIITGSMYSGGNIITNGKSNFRLNVTDIVNNWFNNTWTNNGFIIKRQTTEEQDSASYGLLNFYSLETDTIYEPYIETAWDDRIWSTGSLIACTSSIFVTANNISNYYTTDEPLIRFTVRETWPQKTYTTADPYTVIKYMPSSSYYSIKDSHTSEVIIPFGDYSKVSCDSIGNYIHINLTNFEPYRSYTLFIKTLSDSYSKTFTCGKFWIE